MIDFTYHGHDAEHNLDLELSEAEKHWPPETIQCVVYVGACCGYEAGLIAKRYPWAKVYAVEACKQTFDNFLGASRPCCPESVETRHTAIYDKIGYVHLYLSAINTKHSLLKQNDEGFEDVSIVPVTTLCEFCRIESICPDMLVIDSEGVPACILTMAGEWILSKVKIILCETEPAGAGVFEYGDTDWEVDMLLALKGMKRIVKTVPSGPVRQLNSVWARMK